MKKHEQLVSPYEAAVKGGETDLAPRLEQLRGSLERHNSELTAIRSNPDLANVPAHGQINVEALATGKRYEITTDMLERGGTHYGWGSKNAGSNARTFMKFLKEVPNSKIEVLKDGSIHYTGDTNGSSFSVVFNNNGEPNFTSYSFGEVSIKIDTKSRRHNHSEDANFRIKDYKAATETYGLELNQEISIAASTHRIS